MMGREAHMCVLARVQAAHLLSDPWWPASGVPRTNDLPDRYDRYTIKRHSGVGRPSLGPFTHSDSLSIPPKPGEQDKS